MKLDMQMEAQLFCMSRVLYQWKVFCEMKMSNWIAFSAVECKKTSLCLGMIVFESIRRY